MNLRNGSMRIKTIFYDFDGVMTDNKVIIDQFGNESVVVNRGDGLAVSLLKKAGFRQVIVSTESNKVVEKRAGKLGIEFFQNVGDKGEVLLEYAKMNGIDLEDAIYVGNDLNDISAFEKVGIKAAPCDAEEEVLDVVDIVIPRKGGQGVVRELYRIIM